MKNKQISRRDFFKYVGSFLAGIFLFKFNKLFDLASSKKKDQVRLKEAKYFKEGSHLAG